MRKCMERGHHSAWDTNDNNRADAEYSDNATDTAGDPQVTNPLDMLVFFFFF